MIKLKKNIFKAVVSSVIGIATMIITLILVFTGAIHFVWDGLAGLGAGIILLFTPQSVERLVSQGVKSFGRRMGGFWGGDYGDDNRDDNQDYSKSK